MAGQMIKITAHDGVSLDCYLATPPGNDKVPAIVMASGAFGLNKDMTDISDWWASKGFLVAAPEQWQRGDKGPIKMDDAGRKRAVARISGPGVFETVKKDLEATLKHLRQHPRYNGKSGLMGYCFAGPFAIAAIVELGCDAAGAYHSGNMDHQLENLKKSTKPLQIHWGDKDFALTPGHLDAVRAAAANNKNAEIFIYPGVEHGYTGPESTAWNEKARDLSFERTLTMFQTLKTPPTARAA
jgi:carboxymethylenebutenolidase